MKFKATCHLCDEAFKGQENFVEHLENEHELVRRKSQSLLFVCDLCGWEGTLIRTGIRHLIEKGHIASPYFCDCCGESFRTMGLVNKHEANHNSNTKLRRSGRKRQSETLFESHSSTEPPTKRRRRSAPTMPLVDSRQHKLRNRRKVLEHFENKWLRGAERVKVFIDQIVQLSDTENSTSSLRELAVKSKELNASFQNKLTELSACEHEFKERMNKENMHLDRYDIASLQLEGEDIRQREAQVRARRELCREQIRQNTFNPTELKKCERSLQHNWNAATVVSKCLSQHMAELPDSVQLLGFENPLLAQSQSLGCVALEEARQFERSIQNTFLMFIQARDEATARRETLTKEDQELEQQLEQVAQDLEDYDMKYRLVEFLTRMQNERLSMHDVAYQLTSDVEAKWMEFTESAPNWNYGDLHAWMRFDKDGVFQSCIQSSDDVNEPVFGPHFDTRAFVRNRGIPDVGLQIKLTRALESLHVWDKKVTPKMEQTAT